MITIILSYRKYTRLDIQVIEQQLDHIRHLVREEDITTIDAIADRTGMGSDEVESSIAYLQNQNRIDKFDVELVPVDLETKKHRLRHLLTSYESIDIDEVIRELQFYDETDFTQFVDYLNTADLKIDKQTLSIDGDEIQDKIEELVEKFEEYEINKLIGSDSRVN